MVRVNLINPESLTDQHLIAEYDEILMLLGYVKRYPEEKDIPKEYTLGKGHIKFFKNKIKYLKKRHELIKKEMRERGFVTNKTINLGEFPKNLQKDYTPTEEAKKIIKKRISEKLSLKPEYYRYCREKKHLNFYLELVKKG